MQSSASISSTILEDVALGPFPYTLDLECPVPWPSSQEASICQDYPFPCTDTESPEEFVIRRYLETLWLPESFMPLRYFAYSLRRFVFSPPNPHPLHAALKPLLLSVRATQDKYQLELPQILHDGGGAGELEETMMWFSWSKEKFEPPEDNAANTKEAEEAWRKAWMDRLEKREVQIQIILYLHLLSLPIPPPTTPVASSSKKRKRKNRQARGPPSPVKPIFPPTSSVEVAAIASASPTTAKPISSSASNEKLSMEDRLEYFMDRLSMWQLVASLTPPGSSQSASERDWMQIFCEDVIEPLFKDQLPGQCALLRTKVFPHSPFSEGSDHLSSPPPPNLRTRAKKSKCPASPLRLADLEKPSVQRGESFEPGAPDRRRSRSRSVSVSMEEVKARGASRGGVASSKTLFRGEVEMKRTTSRGGKLFKPLAAGGSQPELTRQNSRPNTFPPRAQSSQPHSPSQGRGPRTLAADTPVKKIVKAEEEDPDIIMDSPDALLLTSRRGSLDNDAQGQLYPTSKIFVVDTPVKKRPGR